MAQIYNKGQWHIYIKTVNDKCRYNKGQWHRHITKVIDTDI